MIVFFIYFSSKILLFVHNSVGEENFDSYSGGLIELIPEIYNVYIGAVEKDESAVTRRLLLNDNNRYMLHINKLKEVNGIKTHNVLVTQVFKTEEPFIYINNPVESHTPYTFLTQEQFKTHLMNQIKKQQIELRNEKIKKHLNLFKIKPKKPKTPFVWRLDISKASTESNLIDASAKSIIDEKDPDYVEDIPATSIPGKKTTTNKSRDLFIAMINGETLPTMESYTNDDNTTTIIDYPSDDVVIENNTTSIELFTTKNNSELILGRVRDDSVNYTDSQFFRENVTTEQPESLNATIDKIEYTTFDTSVSPTVPETREITTTAPTEPTPRTRGRPFVFMGDPLKKD